ncbi:STAS domain-containing protein [Candidatus Peregrinibacteria bacterium]|nr:STAS domain-containing protein [Candidatus Peregrinibacteria bacterium]
MQKLLLSITDYPELPNTKLVYFEGDFDGYAEDTITELQTTIDQAGPGSTIIFEFSKLNYLNSFAIGQLVAWHNAMNAKQGKILIVGINKNIEDIFSVLGIESVFKTYNNLEELKAGQQG